jgi:hypothetical protein
MGTLDPGASELAALIDVDVVGVVEPLPVPGVTVRLTGIQTFPPLVAATLMVVV